MPSLGFPELIVILLIVIVIFGANRLPGLGRGIGSAIKNFKDGMKDEKDDERDRKAHSTTRVSPIRRVTRSRSRYSSSGIANLRVTPKRSLNVATSIRAVAPAPADAFSAATSAFNCFSDSSWNSSDVHAHQHLLTLEQLQHPVRDGGRRRRWRRRSTPRRAASARRRDTRARSPRARALPPATARGDASPARRDRGR